MAERTAPVIPNSAVQTINNQKVVFLTTEKSGVFVMRQVRLGKETENRYVVLGGVNDGDKIVASESFLLRAEWLKQHPGR